MVATSMWSTQISGKYGPENLGVFALKRQLVAAGASVRHPIGDSILEYSVGFTITDPIEATRPFHEAERGFLAEIRDSSFHIVYDIFGDLDGYMGESTAIETAYALAHDKPLILLRSPRIYSDTLPTRIRNLIERYSAAITVKRLDAMPTGKLVDLLRGVAASAPVYGLTPSEKEAVITEARALLQRYHARWKIYLETPRR